MIQGILTGKTKKKVLTSHPGLLLLGPMSLTHAHAPCLGETLAVPDGKRRAGLALQVFTVLNVHEDRNRMHETRMTSQTYKHEMLQQWHLWRNMIC